MQQATQDVIEEKAGQFYDLMHIMRAVSALIQNSGLSWEDRKPLASALHLVSEGERRAEEYGNEAGSLTLAQSSKLGVNMSTQVPDPIEPERVKIAIEAAWESEALCLRMIDMCGLDRLDFRSMAARLLALSHASMAALTDPGHDLKDIRHELGCENFGNTVGKT